MNKKEYKIVDEQIEHLVINKNVIKTTINKQDLINNSYLNVITPYTSLVAVNKVNNNHLYDSNVDFNQFSTLYNLDKMISTILRETIGEFELSLKSYISNIYCFKMHYIGDTTCSDYNIFHEYINGKNNKLDLVSFDKKLDSNNNEVQLVDIEKNNRENLCKKLIDYENTLPKKSLFNHYISKGYMPFWIIVHSLSLGELITLFNMLKTNDKREFILNITMKSKVKTPYINTFCSKLIYINQIRNNINHYEPLFPYIINIADRYFSKLESTLEIICRRFPQNFNFSINTIQSNKFNKVKVEKINKIINIVK